MLETNRLLALGTQIVCYKVTKVSHISESLIPFLYVEVWSAYLSLFSFSTLALTSSQCVGCMDIVPALSKQNLQDVHPMLCNTVCRHIEHQ